MSERVSGPAYTLEPRRPGERETRPCAACGGNVEPWAVTADRRLPQLCDGCQRASVTKR